MNRINMSLDDIERMLIDDLLEDELNSCEWDYLFSDDSSLDSSSSDSEDFESPYEEESPKRKHLAIPTFMANYTESEFHEHFRVSRSTADFLMGKLVAANVVPTHTFGKAKVPAQKVFYMSLWYISNRETYRQISQRFDVTISTAHQCIRLVINYFASLSKDYIKWAEGNPVSKFKKHSLKDATGYIGASHISVHKPYKTQQLEYCYEVRNYSVILQAVCDAQKRFIDLYCGEPGSERLVDVLKRSPLSMKDLSLNDQFVLGGTEYPNLNWLITPFRNVFTEHQEVFNAHHGAKLVVIEEAFYLLKSRFRRLARLDNYQMDFVSKMVEACCVIHNICIDLNDLQIDCSNFKKASYQTRENYDATDDFVEEMFARRNHIVSSLLNEI